MPNPTLKAVLFWQWANQSLNGTVTSLTVIPQIITKSSFRIVDIVCVNYSNANKSIQMSNSEIASTFSSLSCPSLSSV
jgi:hypothetical protein